jgi:hypothetical protein
MKKEMKNLKECHKEKGSRSKILMMIRFGKIIHILEVWILKKKLDMDDDEEDDYDYV